MGRRFKRKRETTLRAQDLRRDVSKCDGGAGVAHVREVLAAFADSEVGATQRIGLSAESAKDTLRFVDAITRKA